VCGNIRGVQNPMHTDLMCSPVSIRILKGFNWPIRNPMVAHVCTYILVYVIGRMAVVFGINSASVVNRKE